MASVVYLSIYLMEIIHQQTTLIGLTALGDGSRVGDRSEALSLQITESPRALVILVFSGHSISI